MGRHLADILELIANMTAPGLYAARAPLSFALRAASGVALQVSWSLWLASLDVAPAPPHRPGTHESVVQDARVNSRGGKA